MVSRRNYWKRFVKKIKRDKNINREILRAKWQTTEYQPDENEYTTNRRSIWFALLYTLLNAFMLCDKRNFRMNVIALGHLVFQLRYCDVWDMRYDIYNYYRHSVLLLHSYGTTIWMKSAHDCVLMQCADFYYSLFTTWKWSSVNIEFTHSLIESRLCEISFLSFFLF